MGRLREVWIGLIAICFLSEVEARDDHVGSSSDRKRNCVDASIIKYCGILGRNVSTSELDQALLDCGLSQASYYRSLQDCKLVLRNLDVSVVAIAVSKGNMNHLFTPCICYIPSTNSDVPGHVIVVEARSSDQFAIWDDNVGSEAKLISS